MFALSYCKPQCTQLQVNIETKIIFFMKNFIHQKVKENNLLVLDKLWLFYGNENFDVTLQKTYFKQWAKPEVVY